MSHSDEKALIQRAQRGDREALAALWDMLTPKIFGYLINVTRNRALAEDLLQSTWLHAIEALPRFEPRGVGMAAWLFAIARNECRRHWRRANRETPLDPLVHDTPSEPHQNRDTTLLVEQTLARLPEDDRELLRLRYIADLRLKDIAAILSINFVTVRVRLHRALARARAALVTHKL